MKPAWRALALLTATLFILVAAGTWLFTQPAGARIAARAITTLSGGQVQAEHLQGRLCGPLKIGRLTLRTTGSTVFIHDLSLAWQPRALTQRRLQIDSLEIARLRIVSTGARKTSLQTPTSLRLPFAFSVQRLAIDKISFGQARSVVALNGLLAQLRGTPELYRVQLQHLASPWGTLQGHASLGAMHPFPLAARLSLARPGKTELTIDAVISGTLLAPHLQAQANSDWIGLHATSDLRPFSAVPIASLSLTARDLDLRSLARNAPPTRINVDIALVGRTSGDLTGTVSLRNQLSGPLDAGRLPLLTANAALEVGAGHVDLTSLQADLGRGGKASGAGCWRNGTYTLSMHMPALNLAGFDSRFFTTRYDTVLDLAGDAARQHLQFTAREGDDHVTANLQRQGDRLDLTKLQAALRGASLEAKGWLELTPERSFSIKGELARLNPANFGHFPRGSLNARIIAAGHLADHPSVETTLHLPTGNLAGRPVSGEARLSLAWPRIPNVRAKLDLAGNRLAITGAWGRPSDELRWNLDAPRLDRLGFGLAGRLHSSGYLTGTWPEPAARFNVVADNLRLPYQLHAATLNLEAHIARGMHGQVRVLARGRGVEYRNIGIKRLNLNLAGTLAHHNLSAQASLADARLDLRATGGWTNETWSGQITRFEVHGSAPYNARLRAPAGLQLGSREQRLQNLHLAIGGGEADIAVLQHDATGFSSQGRLMHLPLAPLLTLANRPLPVTTDLMLQGRWNLAYDGRWHGDLHVARSEGDVALTDPHIDLGLTALSINIAAAGQRLEGEAHVASATLGDLDISGWLAPPAGALWPIPTSTTADVTARANLPTLAVLRPSLPVGAQLDAQVALDLHAQGTLDSPAVSGQLSARAIKANFPELGLRVKDGLLYINAVQNHLQVTQGWLAGQQGRVVIRGGGDWQQGGALLNLDFADFALVTRPDIQATVDGTTRLQLERGRLAVHGDLKVVRARVATLDTGRPRLGSDVIVQGRPPRAAKKEASLPVTLALALDLGDDFQVRAYGLDAQLGGKLALAGSGRPTATGNVEVKRGTYSAYGQRLDIKRGRIGFFGPLDNPSLDILAVRQTGQVTAGVTLTGTAQHPRVSLYSEPAMPDSETLSWLLFGHGLGNLSNEQFSLLQAAAGALLARGEGPGLQATLAEKLGLSSIDIEGGSSGTLAGSVVSLGKQLSRSFRVRYEQSLDGLTQIVRAYYALSPHLSLQAQTGSQSGVDVLYSREFE